MLDLPFSRIFHLPQTAAKRELVVAAPWLPTDVLDDVHRERIS